MKYTREQINLIQEKRPDLRYRAVPTLNNAIVEFLKKYEVFVKPATTGKVTSGDIASGAIAGAIGGLAGADVGGDAVIIGGQKKQTEVQEWTQWKQWALNHNDFEAFKKEFMSRATKYNQNVNRKLSDPEFQKELEPIIKGNEQRIIFLRYLFFALIAIVFGSAIIGNINYEENNNKSSSLLNFSIIKS